MRGLVVVAVLVLAGCASDPNEVADGPRAPSPSASPSGSASAEPSTAIEPKPAKGTRVTTYSSQYGAMLFDTSGQAIYLFDAESSPKPECYDDCAAAWPPVLTDGDPVAGGQVRAGLLGTTKRADGSTQVTYAGHPLYFYAHEGKRQVLCHNIEEYGGLWLIVQPDGLPGPT